MADDEDADALILLAMLTAKQHNKRTVWVIVGNTIQPGQHYNIRAAVSSKC